MVESEGKRGEEMNIGLQAQINNAQLQLKRILGAM